VRRSTPGSTRPLRGAAFLTFSAITAWIAARAFTRRDILQ
jgi:hypothetical protein